MTSFAGKIKILSDVREGKYQLPPEFPSLEQALGKEKNFMSTHYQKTKRRHMTIEQERTGRVQEMFVDDHAQIGASFRNTTRDFLVEKEHRKLLHGAPIGRYCPSYERVWTKAPEI